MYIENVAPANQTERITQLSTAEVQSSFHFQGISGDAATQVAFFFTVQFKKCTCCTSYCLLSPVSDISIGEHKSYSSAVNI